MLMKELLKKKRQGIALSEAEIRFWINGVTQNTIPDYQTTALLMAIFCRGMTVAERSALTLAMRDSGTPMDFSYLNSYVIDKHSSGGIGDKTSLILAPWLAACGLKIPMISGRGLGFTGGTLDKLEAVPGFQTNLSASQRRQALEQIGFFLGGQTAEIAPADKKIYALRDATETVEDISLITASILSKKLSEGLNGLILDIKCGSGAFMKELAQAEELAISLTETARAAGVACQALITRMDFPLGEYSGNLSEVYEAMEFMQPNSAYYHIFRHRIQPTANHPTGLTLLGEISSPKDNLTLVTTALAVQMLKLARNLPVSQALEELHRPWQSGEVLKRFQQILTFQGGDLPAYHARLAKAQKLWQEESFTFKAPQSGYLTSCHGEMLGNLLVQLGAGRQVAEDTIDHEVSLRLLAWEGKQLTAGEPICQIYRAQLSPPEQEKITAILQQAFTISPQPLAMPPYLLKLI